MSKSMHLLGAAMAVVVLAAPVLSTAAEPAAKGGAVVLSESAHAKATIVNIDKKDRKLTLRNEQGEEFTIVAGEEVRNFNQIKKGDIVEVEYHVAVASRLEKASEANAAAQGSAIERAPAGQKPGMSAMRTTSIVATVVDIDHKKRMISARGPRGNVATFKVPEDIKSFDKLKKGDQISAVFTEAIAVSVKTPAKK